MGKLKDLLFGTPEQQRRKKELKLKEQQAYRKAFERARVERARKSGYTAGKTTTTERVKSALQGIDTGLGNLGSFDFGANLFDMGHKKPRKTKKKTRSKATTIKIDGTTITIQKKKRRKKK